MMDASDDFTYEYGIDPVIVADFRRQIRQEIVAEIEVLNVAVFANARTNGLLFRSIRELAEKVGE